MDKECLSCDCYDPDMGCTMLSIDREYACPITANENELKEMFTDWSEENE